MSEGKESKYKVTKRVSKVPYLLVTIPACSLILHNYHVPHLPTYLRFCIFYCYCRFGLSDYRV